MNRFLRAEKILTLALLLAATAFSGCIISEDSWDDHDETDWEDDSHHAASSSSSGATGGKDCEEHEHDDEEEGNATATQDPATAYNDSSPRYHNVVDGKEDSMRTVNVPPGSRTLRVALIHDSNGFWEFELIRPDALPVYTWLTAGGTVALEDGQGTKFMEEPEWVVVHDPEPGDWDLKIYVSGESSYTVGFYLD